MNCLDCGVVIELAPHGASDGARWAKKVGAKSWSYVCRITVDGGRLVAADFHHPRGERQYRWRLGEAPDRY